jgi:Caspase domain
MMRSGLLKLRGFLSVVVLLAAALLVSGPAFAEKRVALILGNSVYQNVPPLSNPINDGAVMAATFKNAGYDVVSRFDLSALDTRRVLRDFADRARDADIAVVYYAGHGMEVDGTNYLIPVDAKLERDTDIYDEAFSLDRILVAVEPAKQLRLVILDACRDNPFARNMKHSLASRSIGRGLAKIEPASPNTLIAYSAKAGSTAQDGDGKNSPFTTALAQHLTTPGLDVRKAFGFVRDDVLKSTSNRQEPFVYGSLGGNDVALVPARAAPPPQAQTDPQSVSPQSQFNPQSEIRRDYELALQVGNKAAMGAFIAQHPDGFYASLAKLQLEKLAAEEAHTAASEKARIAEQERARLSAEGARKEAQAKADADAKSAEAARLAAEKVKQAAVAQQEAAEADRQRSEKITSNPIVAANGAAETPAATPEPATATERKTNVASLNEGPPQADIAKSVQSELRRVGCLKADADGDWNTTSQRSLTQFNRYAKTRLDTKVASSDALDAIKQKPSRVCPLACEHGFEADGDHCSRIVCREGSFLNDDNECEKRRGKTPVAKRNWPGARPMPESRSVPEARQYPEPRRTIVERSNPGDPSRASTGRPLTGLERQQGCNSHQAIMSGVCP